MKVLNRQNFWLTLQISKSKISPAESISIFKIVKNSQYKIRNIKRLHSTLGTGQNGTRTRENLILSKGAYIEKESGN